MDGGASVGKVSIRHEPLEMMSLVRDFLNGLTGAYGFHLEISGRSLCCYS